MSPTEEDERKYRHSDEVATVKFRVETEGALKALGATCLVLQGGIDRIAEQLKEFKMGLGKKADELFARTDSHENRLTRIEVSMGAMVKVMWAIVFSSVAVVAAAFWELIIKK